MWFVKLVSRATKENKNFAGDVSVSIFGKNQKMLANLGDHAERIHTVALFEPWVAKRYGYSRESDAKRSWVFKNPENSKYWETDASIVWIDC